MSDQTFSEFLTFCEDYLRDTDAVELKKLMIRRYNECNHDFKFSNDFNDLVLITRAKIDSDSSRVFVHLRDFLGELKAYRHKKEKKKGTKRSHDSGLSDIETPSPKSLKGDNSESSSDEKVCVSDHKNNTCKSDAELGVELNVQKCEKKSEKSPLVNGKHGNSNYDSVMEVSSQSDDDCVMFIDGNSDNDSKDSLKEKCNKTDDKSIPKPHLSIKKISSAFQAAFKNFTSCKPVELDDSQEQKCRSKLQNESEDVKEISEKSDEKQYDSVEPKVISSKEVNQSNSIEDSEKNSCELKKNVYKANETKCNNKTETVSLSDLSSSESPKPSTSSDYKIPANLEDSEIDACNESDIPSDNATDSKVSKVKDENDKINNENGATDLKSLQNGDVGTKENQSVTDSPEKPVKMKKASQRQIRRLEQLLEDIRDQIEKLKERELSLDDLDDDESAYVLEDKYQKKFVKVWNKLCELKGRAETTGRPTERRFIYNGTRYPEINRKIERFVNRKKLFPDYGDIHNIIAKVNLKQGLGLKGPRVDQLSRETFADVGNRLQKRRKEDLNITFLGHLTRNTSFQLAEDPALKDPDLKKTLEENKKVSKTKIEEVINKYADKQVGEDTEESMENKEENKDDGNEDEAEEEDDEETEDIEVPEINHIIHDISDEEGENKSDDVSPSEVIITPMKERKKRIEDTYSDSSSENEDSGDESIMIDKEAKVVVTDIKYNSPYKYGLDVLVKESDKIVIETDENNRQESQELIEIDEDEREDCENKNSQGFVEDTNNMKLEKKTRNLMAEFDKTENDEGTKTDSSELNSEIDSDLIDEDSASLSNDDDLLVVKSRSTTPELNLKITAVRHIEQVEIYDESGSINCDSESENKNSEGAPIGCAENLNDHSESADYVNDEKSTENFETISVDSSENDSEDMSSFSEMAAIDQENKVVGDCKINTADSSGENESHLSKSSVSMLHISKFESSFNDSSSSSSSSSSSVFSSKSDIRTSSNEACHTEDLKKSDVIEIDDSEDDDDDDDDDEEEPCRDEINDSSYDQNSIARDENADDNDEKNETDDCCIILSDSD